MLKQIAVIKFYWYVAYKSVFNSHPYCLICPTTQIENHYVAYRLAPKPVILSYLHVA